VTLAHVGRMLALASALDPHRFDVLVAADPRYQVAVSTATVPVRPIHTIPARQFFDALDRGRPIYDWRDLVGYVEADRAMLAAFRPDAVVGDFRLSLAASARLDKVPYLTVTNAYWGPYAKVRFVVPDVTPTRLFGVRAAQGLFNAIRPLVFAQHAAPVNRMLRHFGLPAGRRSLRHAYTDADYTLYSDIRELVPTEMLPAHHRFIGPVQWSAPVGEPAWWHDLPRDRPVVYVNLGSSGDGGVLSRILDALAPLPVTVVAATAGRVEAASLQRHQFVADYLPGDRATARAAVVVCNGGSPTCYQALAGGKPVVGVPQNLDQYLNMTLVEQAGAGVLVRRTSRTPAAVATAVQRLLKEPDYQQQAKRLQQAIAQYSPVDALESSLQDALAMAGSAHR
jgi:UDP:flavonoid glycosyltransferase YjiC (YdhE family)